MKTLTATLVSTLLAAGLSTTATAYDALDTYVTPMTTSKQAAYDMGLQKLNQLKSVSSYQLYYMIDAALGDFEYDSLEVSGDSYIEVEERMTGQGKVGYVGVVNVGLNYETRDDNDD